MDFKRVYLFLVFVVCFLCPVQVFAEGELDWPVETELNKPGAIWWWPGFAVDKESISWNLEQMAEAGMGGGTLVPIYGVKGAEDRFIDFLSEDWFEMVSFACEEAQRLGLWIDMTPGTGWRMGGQDVSQEMSGQVAVLKDGKISSKPKLMKVKRAAPGGDGYAINPYSVKILESYLERFEKFYPANSKQAYQPRALYHDSFEYEGDYCDEFLEEFKSRRGYDIDDYSEKLFAEEQDEITHRLVADYNRTLSELHYDFVKKFVEWSRSRGFKLRNQSHGAPANVLDTYALADIAETENFGSAGEIKIPGYTFEQMHIRSGDGRAFHPMVNKFASSASHISGKRFTGSETCTWLRNHFNTSLSHIKPVIDQLFVNGINQVYFHGMCFSPEDADWPGWLFYASVQYNPRNAFWKDVPAMNKYVTRVQSVLQLGLPAEDVLVYWPIEDLWHSGKEFDQRFAIHDAHWHKESKFGELVTELKKSGFGCDYISDKQIRGLKINESKLIAGGCNYSVIMVPECVYMPLETLEALLMIARQGGKVVFESLPSDVPGFRNFGRRRVEQASLLKGLKFKNRDGYLYTKYGRGEILFGSNVPSLMQSVGLKPEGVSEFGVEFIKRTHKEGYNYFISSIKGDVVDGWVSMGTNFKSAVIMNPLTGKVGVAKVRQVEGVTQVYLQLKPGQSIILRTFFNKDIAGASWDYYQEKSEPIVVDAKWKLEFIDGGPVLPEPMTMDKLVSWTVNEDKESQRFAGTVRYSSVFTLPKMGNGCLLNLGRVCESAKVVINGVDVGVLWSLPFEVEVGEYLREGENRIEIEVTNLSANRIRDLDTRGVGWKKFYDINIVTQNYKKFDASVWPVRDSGLLGVDGHILLIPLVNVF